MSFVALCLLFSAFNVLYSQTISGGGTGPYPKPNSSSSFVLGDYQGLDGFATFDPSLQLIRIVKEMPLAGNHWERSNISANSNLRKAFLLQTRPTMPFDPAAVSWQKEGNWNAENKINNPIADYESYLNDLQESQIMEGWDDVNIYAQYIHLNKDRMRMAVLKNLYDHWNTDLSSPSGFARYQYKPDSDFSPAQNLDWMMAQEDIQNAVNQWMDYQQSEDDSNDLPWDRIESVIFQDGREVSLDDIRGLSSKPESVELGEMIIKY